MNAFIKLAALAAFATSVAGNAQQSTSVAIHDLNLATNRGQKILALRIDRAARRLCASEVLSQSPNVQRAERACIASAKASAMALVEKRQILRIAKQ